jgi:beta-lactam-binding protein with PASTA domain
MEDLRFYATYAMPVEQAAKVVQFVKGTKRPPKVIMQHPPAGTPVIAGMTIEIETVSFSDVPMRVLDEAVAAPVKNVPVAEVEKIFETDQRFKDAVNSGKIREEDRAFVTETFNRELAKAGYNGALSADEMQIVVQSFNSFGFEF